MLGVGTEWQKNGVHMIDTDLKYKANILGPTTCRQLAVNSLAQSTRRQLLQCTFKTHKRSIEL